MKELRSHRLVKQFLEEVCRHVKAAEQHSNIQAELVDHINDRVMEYKGQGKEEEEAIARAVADMGTADAVGSGLHRIYRPIMDWSLAGLLLLFLALGIVAIFSVQSGLTHFNNGDGFVGKSVLFSMIGLGIVGALWFFDYRKLKLYSYWIFGSALLLMLITAATGIQINGANRYFSIGPFIFDTTMIALLLLLIALPGMSAAKEWSAKQAAVQIACRLVVPLALFVNCSSYVAALFYVTGFFIHLWMTRRSARQFGLLAGSIAILAAVVFSYMMNTYTFSYRFERLTGFITMNDPLGINYVTVQSIEAINSAGWWGHGPSSILERLPYPHSDNVFAYLVYCFGWAGGIAIAAIVLLFIMKIGQLVRKQRNSYGKLVMLMLFALLSIQFVVPMLAAYGLAPRVDISIPFVSYGGTQLLVNCATVGLILAINKRRNLTAA